jgi:DcuC family C4-dicarboxylate transporter
VSVVGPVLIPLLFAAGISRETAGALLLLGGSMGGELLNPAAVEVTAIKTITHDDAQTVIRHLLPYNLLASGTALLVFWLLAVVRERRGNQASEAWSMASEGSGVVHDAHAAFRSNELNESVAKPASGGVLDAAAQAELILRINPFKAIVPLVPIMLLMFVRKIIAMPAVLTTNAPDNPGEQATIAAAMLVGVVCAALTAPRKTPKIAAAFFEGAGFAFTYIISVIAAATMFAKAIDSLNLIKLMTDHLRDSPAIITVVSIVIPWLMATVTGTAVGTAPLVIGILLPIAMGAAAPDASIVAGRRVGAINAIAAQFGRTTSPVAPVVIMCATLSQSRPMTMARRCAIPLICGGAVLLAAAWRQTW